MEAQPRALTRSLAQLAPASGSSLAGATVAQPRVLPDLRPLVLPILLLASWELFSRSGWVNPVLVPSLVTIAESAVKLALAGELWLHGWATLQRILFGFALAAVAGIGIGIACALSRWTDRLMGGPLAAIRQVPLFGWIPLIAVLAGIGEGSKVAFVALAAFYPIALNTTQAIRATPAELLEVGQVLRFSSWTRLRRLLLPQALPGILTGLKHGLNFAGVAVVAAEVFMTASPGLGNLLEYGQTNLRTDLVLIGVVAVGILGFILNQLIDRVSARLLRWRTTAR